MSKVMKFTKIVATLAEFPQSRYCREVALREGADVIRLNFSHSNFDDHALGGSTGAGSGGETEPTHRHLSGFTGSQDSPRPTGRRVSGGCGGETLVLTTDDLIGGIHDGVKKIAIDHRSLHEEVASGDRILIDDKPVRLHRRAHRRS
ncbi:MAG: pyruvate kinase [Candidatus Competibacteraceae bacterium]